VFLPYMVQYGIIGAYVYSEAYSLTNVWWDGRFGWLIIINSAPAG